MSDESSMMVVLQLMPCTRCCLW